MAKKCLMAFIVLMFFASADSWAFRCGTGLVSSGDTKTQVLLTCGKPTFKDTSCEHEDNYIPAKNNKKSKKCTKIERWHYNCGDGDFIYVLSFKNGILKNETAKGRGKDSSGCRGK